MSVRPPKLQLKCPRCRSDIGGLVSLDDLRRVVKRLERRLSFGKMAIKRADVRKAAVGLRRMVMRETNLELNITDAGKRLGLRDLSQQIVELIAEEVGLDYPNGANDSEQREHRGFIAGLVEKKIIEYFTKED